MANLGFVGLGVMGSQMVNRLLSKGHTVTGYNRTRKKAQWLIDKGMRWADSPRAVSAVADFTFAMVTNSAAITSITEGADGLLAGLSPGKVFIDMSTVSPSVSRALAAKVREKGAEMVDSPVSGSVITLQEGKLSVMVGGRVETFERVKPLLLDIGPKVTHVGDNACFGDEDCGEPESRGSNDGFLGRFVARGEEWNRTRDRGGRADAQCSRFAHDSIPRTICLAAAGRSLVRRQHDAERHAACYGVGTATRCASPHHGG